MTNTRPAGQWTEFSLTCTNQFYAAQINGELVMSWTDPMRRSAHGYVGLQNYNDGKTVRFRHLRIHPLP